ncbi:MAG TPA: TlpA disulfide reductase family protein [Nitrospirota bacterium]|nr:TlpA disulfide reductase family protein [Nitrospirota bacterium]
MSRKYLVTAILVLAVLFGCTHKGTPSGGNVAADFVLQDMNGNNVRLSDYRGKVVLLEFWATWCPPCRASIPGIEKLYNAYKDKGLVVLAVSLDEGGWDAVKSFISSNGMTYTVLKGNDDVSDSYQVRTIPMMLVVDKDGRISKRYLGFGNEEDLEKDIQTIL